MKSSRLQKVLNHFSGLLLFAFIFINALSAFAVPGKTTYQAKIVKPDGYPLEATSVNFKFTILDPAGSCILYAETYSSVNMSSTSGLISFALGSGVKTYPASATTFEQVFSNITPSLSCDTGGPASYSPTASDIRKIVMQFHDGNGWQTLPAMSINAVPYAMYANEATKLNGLTSSDFVQLSTVPTCAASEALRYTGIGFTCIAVGNSVTSSTVVTALGYTPADGVSVTTLTANVSSVSSTVFSVSSTVTSLQNSVAASFAAITSSQWTTSGTNIFYNTGNIGIGTATPVTKLDVSGGVRIGAESTTCAPALAGTLRYNASNVEYCNGTSWQAFGVSGAGLQSLNGSTSGTQSFATGTGGTAPNVVTANGVHTLNIPDASTGSVTAGLISNTDYTTFTNKITSSAASIAQVLGYVPADNAASGTYAQKANNLSDLTNIATARTNLGLGTFATASSIDLGSASATGTLAIARLPSFTGDATIVAASNTIILSNSGVTAGTYTKITVDAKGRVTSSSALASSDVTTALGYTPANSATIVSSQWTTSGTSISYNTGNVGIGTTSPGAALHAIGNFNLSNAAVNYGAKFQTNFGAGNLVIQPYDNSSDGVLIAAHPTIQSDPAKVVFRVTDNSYTTPWLSVMGGGNIGIGTSSPSAKFEVSGTSNFLDNVTIAAGRKLGIGVGPGSYSLKTDIGEFTTSVYTPQVLSLSGGLNFGSNGTGNKMILDAIGNIGIGTTTPVTKLDVSGGVRISMESATCAVSFAGTLRYNTGNVEYCNGTTWSAFGVATSGLTSLNGAASQTQSFANGTAGTAPAFNTANGVHTLDIPLASTGSVTAGLISNTDYTTFTNKITSSAASIAQVLGYVPANDAVSGTYAQKANNLSDLTNIATARTNLGLGTFATASSIDLGSASATGTLAIARLPSFTGDATIVAASNTIILSNSGITAGTYTKVTVDAKGRVTSSSALASTDVTTALGYTPASASASTQWTTSGSAIYYNTGNVGIGTSAPTATLEVSGAAQISAGSDGVNSFNTHTRISRSSMIMGTPSSVNALAESVVGSLGFLGYAQSHGQMAYIASSSNGRFEFKNVSSGGPSLSINDVNSYPYGTVVLGRLGFSTSNTVTMLSNTSVNHGDSSGIGGHTSRSINWEASNQGYVAALANTDATSASRNGLLVKTAATDTGSYIARFESGGSNKVTIRSDGNVGIGTTNPSYPLHVNGTVYSSSNISNMVVGTSGQQMEAGNSALTTLRFDSDAYRIFAGGGAGEIVHITETGSVGIGTTAPSAKLHLPAGTSSIAALKFTSGTLLTSPQSGTMEYDGTNFYLTDSTNTRRAIAANTNPGTYDNVSDINSSSNITLTPTGSVVVSSTTASTNSSTGALVVKGGLGVAGNLNVAGTISGSAKVMATGFRANQGSPDSNDSSTNGYAFGSDGDTGMFSPGSGAANGVLAFYGNNAELMRITSGGNVGIGTSAPEGKLEIKLANTMYNAAITKQSDYGDAVYLTTNSNPHKAALFLRGSDKIGAGIESGREDAGTTWKTYLAFMTNNLTAGANPVDSIQEKMRITADGNVGIGTSNPVRQLDIYHPTNSAFAVSTAAHALYGGADANHPWIGSSSNSSLRLVTSSTEKMRITADGKVGIGTTAPMGILHVNGAGWGDQTAIPDTIAFPTSGTGGVIIDGNYSDGRHRTRLSSIDRAGGLSLYVQRSAGVANAFSNVARFGDHNQSTMEFEVFGDAAFSGNVGIGTTGPTQKLDVVGTIRSGNSTAVQGSMLLMDAYTNGSLTNLGTEYSSGGPMLGYGVTPSTVSAAAFLSSTPLSLARSAMNMSDSIRFYTGAAQTVSYGTSVSLSEVMRITNSGNVGIGTTSPASKLDVNGLVISSGFSFNGSEVGADTGLFEANDGLLQLKSNGAVVLHTKRGDNEGGYVGIGTTSPTEKLHVQGNSKVGDTATTGTVYMQLLGMHDTAGGSGFRLQFDRTNDIFGISREWSGFQSPSFVIKRSDGNVGIGTSNPQRSLHVNGDAYVNAIVGGQNNGSGNFHLDAWSSGADRSVYLNWSSGTGGAKVGNGSAAYGPIAASAFNVSSDRRLKENIKPIENPLEKILKIDAVTFTWKDATRNKMEGERIGLIAQNVEQIFPQAVKLDHGENTLPGGTRLVNYPDLVSPIIAALKEFYALWLSDSKDIRREMASIVESKADKAEIEVLREKSVKLESENAAKAKEIEALKAYLCSKDPAAPICK